MALIKGKQIQSLDAAKIVETSTKKFVTAAQLTAIGTIANKLEVSDLASYVTQSGLSTTLADYAVPADLTGKATVASLADYAALTGGKIDIAAIPAGALERVVTVANQTAQYALTTAEVQLGDVVKLTDPGTMYVVIDEAKLDEAAGYTTYIAAADWAALENAPTSAVADIDAVVGKKDKIGYSAQKVITIGTNGQTTVNTGIMTNGTTSYFTDSTFPVEVFLNGFLQKAGAGNDYTIAVVTNQLVITWLDKDSVTLETDDEFVVKYTQLV